MKPQLVRWTVIVIVVLLAVSLAVSAIPSRGASRGGTATSPTASPERVHLPPVNAPADYQLGGAYPPAAGVRVVTRDRTEAPAGRYDICYVNAFQTQPGELRWWREHHPRLLLRRADGTLIRDPGWPDEVLLDTRTATRRTVLTAVLGRWVRGCARAGYDAVEPDNLDSWTRSRHRLARSDNLALAGRLVAVAHRNGLAIAQKNTAELTARQVRRAGFDFAVAEECQVYDEFGVYRRRYGAHVIEIEYADNGRRTFERACRARGARWSIVYGDRDLVAAGERGYVRATC